MTRNCPRCQKDMVYKNAMYYHRAVKANSVCNTCGQFVRYKKPTQPVLPVAQYEFLGVTEIEICKESFIPLQVVRFGCPHCQVVTVKRVHPEGWMLKATCLGCGNGYTLNVLPAKPPVIATNNNESKSWAICIER